MTTKNIADNMLRDAIDHVYGTIYRKSETGRDKHFWIAVALFQHAYNLYDTIYGRYNACMLVTNHNRAYCTVNRLRDKLRENS